MFIDAVLSKTSLKVSRDFTQGVSGEIKYSIVQFS